MFAITVTEKGGEQRRLDFDKSEITIGRVQGNDVILPKGNVSKRHARIVLKDGKFIVVDLKSTNGTYVNGRKISSPLVVKEADKIYIGDFILAVEVAAMDAPEPEADEQEAATDIPSMSLGAPPPSAPPSLSIPPPIAADPVPAPLPPAHDLSPGIRHDAPMAASPSIPPPIGSPRPSTPSRAPRPSSSLAPPTLAMPNAGGGMSSLTPPVVSTPMPSPGPSIPPPIAPSLSTPIMAPPHAAPSHSTPPPIGNVALPSSNGQSLPPPLAASTPFQVSSLSSAARNTAAPKPRLVGAGASVAPPPAKNRPSALQIATRRATAAQPLDPKIVQQLEYQAVVLERVIPKLDLQAIAIDQYDEELWRRAESAIVDAVENLHASGELPDGMDQDQLIKDSLNETLGLGPLEDLLADEKTEEVIVDRRDRVIVGRAGVMMLAPCGFSSDDALRRVVERLVAPTGQIIDDSHPMVDVRLRDGSRLVAMVPPIVGRGACLSLRKPKTVQIALADLVATDVLTDEMASFLSTCVALRKNILVCGSADSGRTQVLSALAAASPQGERILSIEEAAEISLAREDWTAFETAGNNGASLLQAVLRLRPDRLIVGELRGSEMGELVYALGSSRDATCVASGGDGAKLALLRLAMQARTGEYQNAHEAAQFLVAQAFDVIVHVVRYADGMVRVASIDELLGSDANGFVCQNLFVFRGMDTGFAPAGVVPSFYNDLESRGLSADSSIFGA